MRRRIAVLPRTAIERDTGAMAAEAERLAMELWSIARADGQCARVVPDDGVAAEVRGRVRRLAAEDGIRVRTARMGGAVVIARLDASVWTDDAATMRRKLAPHPDG